VLAANASLHCLDT